MATFFFFFVHDQSCLNINGQHDWKTPITMNITEALRGICWHLFATIPDGITSCWEFSAACPQLVSEFSKNSVIFEFSKKILWFLSFQKIQPRGLAFLAYKILQFLRYPAFKMLWVWSICESSLDDSIWILRYTPDRNSQISSKQTDPKKNYKQHWPLVSKFSFPGLGNFLYKSCIWFETMW